MRCQSSEDLDCFFGRFYEDIVLKTFLLKIFTRSKLIFFKRSSQSFSLMDNNFKKPIIEYSAEDCDYSFFLFLRIEGVIDRFFRARGPLKTQNMII